MNPDGNRGNPNMTVINESGLYSLVLAGTSPSDAAFGRASSPARVRAYKEWIRMLLL